MARMGITQTTHANEVLLAGRVSGEVAERTLPSGDLVVQLRLVVPRGDQPARGNGSCRATVDTIDVACWSSALRRKALRLREGMEVEVRGALRRRFWRAGGGPVSRYEVEARALRRQHPAVSPVDQQQTMSG
jgi:single-strand DNA-binding protein